MRIILDLVYLNELNTIVAGIVTKKNTFKNMNIMKKPYIHNEVLIATS